MLGRGVCETALSIMLGCVKESLGKNFDDLAADPMLQPGLFQQLGEQLVERNRPFVDRDGRLQIQPAGANVFIVEPQRHAESVRQLIEQRASGSSTALSEACTTRRPGRLVRVRRWLRG